MASSDWSALTGILTTQNCARGVTAGTTKPNGGGSFAYAFNSLTSTAGCSALAVNQTNFAPMSKGGIITASMVRLASGGNTGWSCFVFLGASGNAVSDSAYMLGLSDGDPSYIELRKGTISGGLPDEAPGGTYTVLRRSTASVALGSWVHLKLESVVNSNGDVVLNVFQNDLTARACDSPHWSAIPGMTRFIDDALQINTGSAPLASGYAGFGTVVSSVSRRSAFDYLMIARQL